MTTEYEVTDILKSGVSANGLHIRITYATAQGQNILLKIPLAAVGHYTSIIDAAASKAHQVLSQHGHSVEMHSRVVRLSALNVGKSPEYEGYLMECRTVQNVSTLYETPRDILEQLSQALPSLLKNEPK